MSTPSRSLNYVAPVFRVVDLNRSIAFYRDKLGFELEFNYAGFYASVMRDGYRIHLNCCTPPNRDQQAFEAAEHIDICIGVNDAGTLASQFTLAGITFTVPLRSMPYGKEFYIKDPDGYILGFVQ
jgi:catechol 2,3-dioxygenase-like lactoylglutathione lyase family enzyme